MGTDTAVVIDRKVGRMSNQLLSHERYLSCQRNCWILDDDPCHVLSVEVPSSKTVSHLRKTIKNGKNLISVASVHLNERVVTVVVWS
jgi:hypothetical protein